jgi:anti-sigma factor RsiW
MKPCAKNKPRIAWMASGILEDTEAEALRKHLEICPGCQRYWQSMSELPERLTNRQHLPHAEPSASFHRRLVQRIAAQQQDSPFFIWLAVIRRFLGEHRLAAAISTVLVIAVLLWQRGLNHDEQHLPSRVTTAEVDHGVRYPVSPPTLASYHRAAGISLETLDARLTQEAVRKSVATETFTVSSLLRHPSEN